MRGLDSFYRAYESLKTNLQDNREYAELRDALKDANEGTDILKSKYLRRKIELDWVEKIEAALLPIDRAIREMRRFIIQEEEVVPVERAKKINVESIRHLAQHTYMIAEVKDDGCVTPERILNIFREESYEIYENRFLYTLLNNLIFFVDTRYKALAEMPEEGNAEVKVGRSFTLPEDDAALKLDYKGRYAERTDFDLEQDVLELTDFQRVIRIRKILQSFQTTPLMRALEGCQPVRPPIVRTNLLTKNVNFKHCLDLWTFIESYRQAGYEFINEETDGKMTDDLEVAMYDVFTLAHFVTKLNTNSDLRERLAKNFEAENRRRSDEAARIERERIAQTETRIQAARTEEVRIRDREIAKREALIKEYRERIVLCEELITLLTAEVSGLRRELADEKTAHAQDLAYEIALRRQQTAELERRRVEEVAAIEALRVKQVTELEIRRREEVAREAAIRKLQVSEIARLRIEDVQREIALRETMLAELEAKRQADVAREIALRETMLAELEAKRQADVAREIELRETMLAELEAKRQAEAAQHQTEMSELDARRITEVQAEVTLRETMLAELEAKRQDDINNEKEARLRELAALQEKCDGELAAEKARGEAELEAANTQRIKEVEGERETWKKRLEGEVARERSEGEARLTVAKNEATAALDSANAKYFAELSSEKLRLNNEYEAELGKVNENFRKRVADVEDYASERISQMEKSTREKSALEESKFKALAEKERRRANLLISMEKRSADAKVAKARREAADEIALAKRIAQSHQRVTFEDYREFSRLASEIKCGQSGKIRVVTDCEGSLTAKDIADSGITVIPTGIGMSAKPQELLEFMRPMLTAGDRIIAVMSSGKLSAVSGMMQLVADDIPSAEIDIIDTDTVFAGCGALAMLVAKVAASSGSADAAAGYAELVKNKVKIKFITESAADLVGSEFGKYVDVTSKEQLMSCSMSVKNGVLVPDGIYKNGFDEGVMDCAASMQAELRGADKSGIYILHNGCDDVANRLREYIADMFHFGHVSVIGAASPVFMKMSQNTVAIAYCENIEQITNYYGAASPESEEHGGTTAYVTDFSYGLSDTILANLRVTVLPGMTSMDYQSVDSVSLVPNAVYGYMLEHMKNGDDIVFIGRSANCELVRGIAEGRGYSGVYTVETDNAYAGASLTIMKIKSASSHDEVTASEIAAELESYSRRTVTLFAESGKKPKRGLAKMFAPNNTGGQYYYATADGIEKYTCKSSPVDAIMAHISSENFKLDSTDASCVIVSAAADMSTAADAIGAYLKSRGRFTDILRGTVSPANSGNGTVSVSFITDEN